MGKQKNKQRSVDRLRKFMDAKKDAERQKIAEKRRAAKTHRAAMGLLWAYEAESRELRDAYSPQEEISACRETLWEMKALQSQQNTSDPRTTEGRLPEIPTIPGQPKMQ